MHIRELPENSQITVIASIKSHYLEFPTTVLKVLNDNVLVDLIKNEEGKPISLASDKIQLDISYLESENASPFVWKNVKINYVKAGQVPYHMITQTSDAKKENRRGAFRLFVGEKAQLSFLSKKGNIPVILKDISSTGFAFVSNEELANGKICKVTCLIDEKTLVLSGAVVRKQPIENGGTVYGCKMENFSKELERFIAQKQREAMHNKMK